MRYQPEIDGLRAIAILSVILFHFFPLLVPSGFLGVDIFFVISGFVITGSFAAYPEGIGVKAFLLEFYARRVRRLMPALMVCVVLTAALLVVLTSRPTFEMFGTAMLSLVGLSNVYLYLKQQDYFALDSQINPFTHTWSLGVEEQFYFLYPLFALTVGIVGSRARSTGLSKIIIALAILIAISFWAQAFTQASNPTAAFYLSPYRFWELLIGCLAYLCSSAHGRLSGSPGLALGLLAFLIASVCVDLGNPAISTMLVCAATGVLLASVTAGRSRVLSALLCNAPATYIGKISYSLYLYHWPLLVLSALTIGNSRLALLVALVLAFLLAAASFHLVEQPAKRSLSLLPAAAVIATFVVAVVPLGYVLGSSMPGYVQSSNTYLASTFNIPSAPAATDIPCHGAQKISETPNALYSCLGTKPNGTPGDVFIVGDSHAAHFALAVKKILPDGRNLHFMNTERTDEFPFSFWNRAGASKDRLLEQILSVADTGDHLLIAFHRGWLNDHRDRHISTKTPITPNRKSDNFLANMNFWAPRFAAKGVKIVLALDTPLLSYVTTVETCLLQQRLFDSNSCTVSKEQDLHTRTRQAIVFQTVQQRFPIAVSVFDPAPYVYGTDLEFNPIGPNDLYKMTDWNHMSEQGLHVLLDPLKLFIERTAAP